MLHPLLGEVIAITEVVVALTVIAVALFGSKALSERAFRLLRWFGNRPEPSAPNLQGGNPLYHPASAGAGRYIEHHRPAQLREVS